MWYVILYSRKADIYGPFDERFQAYQWLADKGGVNEGRVISDRAAQESKLYRNIQQP